MESAPGRRYWPATLVLLAGVVLATVQLLTFPQVDPPGIEVFGEVLFLTVTGGCVLYVTGIQESLAENVSKPMFLGLGVLFLRSVTDVLDEVLNQPKLFMFVFEDLFMVFGTLSVVVGISRWADSRRRRERLLLERERRLEAQRSELERQADRLDSFASVVSHDLRNPIDIARGYVDVLRAQVETTEAENGTVEAENGTVEAENGTVEAENGTQSGAEPEHLDTIDDALTRMEEIIDDALALARIGPAAVDAQPTPLQASVDDAWSGVDTEEATLVTEFPQGTLIEADETFLRRLLENLYRNAVEHAGPEPTVRVSLVEDGFAVSDDGPGIPADEREDALDAGYTTAADGTGFGLSIVERIAGVHGWQLRVTEATATDDGGARFEFTNVAVDSDPEQEDTESGVAVDDATDWAGGMHVPEENSEAG
jgi:signal transduction histidine kinase